VSRQSIAADITPRADGDICETVGCTTSDLLAEIDPEGDVNARVLCPEHRVEFLREVTDI